MQYVNEIWLVKEKDGTRTKIRMPRSKDVMLEVRISAKKFMKRLQWNNESFLEFLRLKRMVQNSMSIKCQKFEVNRVLARGRPRKKWREVIGRALKA